MGKRAVVQLLGIRGAKLHPILIAVVVAEWLRRQTRNLLGSARAGSNPADYAFFSIQDFTLLFSLFLASAFQPSYGTDLRLMYHLAIPVLNVSANNKSKAGSDLNCVSFAPRDTGDIRGRTSCVI